MKQHHLEAEHRYKQTQIEYALELQKKQNDFDLISTRTKNDESMRSLQMLSAMGVDLTKLLCTRYPQDKNFNVNLPVISALLDKSKAAGIVNHVDDTSEL